MRSAAVPRAHRLAGRTAPAKGTTNMLPMRVKSPLGLGRAIRSSRPAPALAALPPGAASAAAVSAPTAPPSTADRASPAPAPQPEGGSFDYERCWWPVHAIDSVDPARPTPLELLGKKLVLWKDGGGEWRCMEDACPHRLAPLSEGRVDNGQLECSYHGWKFGGDGRCTRIPQAVDAKAEATACASQRSCVRSYPTKVAGAAIWVWAHPGSPDLAATTPLPIPRAMQAQIDEGKRLRWYRRILPYSWDVLLENVTDPAHLPHSHHKLTPALSRDKSGPMPFAPVAPDGSAAASAKAAAAGAAPAPPLISPTFSSPPDYAFPYSAPVGSFAFPSALSPYGLVAFNPPCSVVYEYNLPGSGKMWTLIYGTPAGPGRCIVLTTSANNAPNMTSADVWKALLKNPKAFIPTLFRLSLQNIPLWRAHMISNKLFDQDGVFLHQQDMLLERKGRSSWQKDYYMPVQCDSLIIATRKWIEGKAGGGPPYAPGSGPLAPLPMEAIHDRWAQHTKHCVPCRTAMEQFERRAAAARVAAAALFAVLCALLGSFGLPKLLAGGAPAVATLVAAAGLGVAIAVGRAAERMVQQFKYVGFNHADNH